MVITLRPISGKLLVRCSAKGVADLTNMPMAKLLTRRLTKQEAVYEYGLTLPDGKNSLCK